MGGVHFKRKAAQEPGKREPRGPAKDDQQPRAES
jgi:hypothetical protein